MNSFCEQYEARIKSVCLTRKSYDENRSFGSHSSHKGNEEGLKRKGGDFLTSRIKNLRRGFYMYIDGSVEKI